MNTPKRYLITAALPYANGLKHIGHLAGAYLPADIYVRYLKAQKRDVVFVCGSDEHGTAIPIQATKEGTTAQAIIDKYHPIIEQNFKDLGIAFDVYHRTSDALHHETASAFFKDLEAKGDLETKTSLQYFDAAANSFLADRYIKGTCPNCAYHEAYGDQCEKCGKSLSPEELINPVSTLSGNAPIKKETTHWYLPLNKHEDFLREWILKEHVNDWRPAVVGQCKSWIDGGLQPRAVTRDLDWGVKVPVAGGDGKVLYVWFDAPIGYISATKQWAKDNGKDWTPYWNDSETKLVHFIGKDNIVFHCIIFPAMLKAEGSYILPKNVPANEFLNLEGQKLSTSKNWAVWLPDYLKAFPDQQDVLRYVLTATAPETKDNDFTWKDFQARNNNELVAVYGNFINRVLVLTHKYYSGKVPQLKELTVADKGVLGELSTTPKEIQQSLERFRFREASQILMNLARSGNKYLADEEPWKVIKTNPERVQTIMYTALQIASGLSVLSEPFLPHTAEKLQKMLRLDPIPSWQDVRQGHTLLASGHCIGKPSLLFTKIEDPEIEEQLDLLKASKKSNAVKNTTAVQKTSIPFGDFSKMDLRVGTILTAKKMPKTKKLLVLEVDTGTEVRTIVSGIAEAYAPEAVVGKKVTVLCNLKPRDLRGVESQGMILMAKSDDGQLVFIQPDITHHTVSGVSIC